MGPPGSTNTWVNFSIPIRFMRVPSVVRSLSITVVKMEMVVHSGVPVIWEPIGMLHFRQEWSFGNAAKLLLRPMAICTVWPA